jgi:hypothetical protein
MTKEIGARLARNSVIPSAFVIFFVCGIVRDKRWNHVREH